MSTKLVEHTYGGSAFMRIELDDGSTGEVSAYFRENGTTFRTTADGIDNDRREALIDAFNELY